MGLTGSRSRSNSISGSFVPPTSPTSGPRSPTAQVGAKTTNAIDIPIAPQTTLQSNLQVNLAISPSQPTLTTSEKVPAVFTWTHGGNEVYLTGTFCNWKEKIPLNKSERDFSTILELPPGVHQYVFLVDGKRKTASEQPQATDTKGNLINCMEVKRFCNLVERMGENSNSNLLERSSPPGSYNQKIPEYLHKFLTEEEIKQEKKEDNKSGTDSTTTSPIDETKTQDKDKNNSNANTTTNNTNNPNNNNNNNNNNNKEAEDERQRAKFKKPPALPPHLLRSLLNTSSPNEDPTELPLPHSVMLNHLYCRQTSDDHQIFGTTTRYREKFVTTIFYTNGPNSDTLSVPTSPSPVDIH